MNKLVFNSLLLLAIALTIVGLKFTSIGVGPTNSIQNDGYNVTGGVMTCVGGFILGYIIIRRKYK